MKRPAIKRKVKIKSADLIPNALILLAIEMIFFGANIYSSLLLPNWIGRIFSILAWVLVVVAVPSGYLLLRRGIKHHYRTNWSAGIILLPLNLILIVLLHVFSC